MKFRYKVVLINFLLLAVSLAIVGYLMVYKNYELAKKTELKNAIIENNLMQASVEYELLAVLEEDRGHVEEQIPGIGRRVSGSLQATGSLFFIRYDDVYIFESSEEKVEIPSSLFENMQVGRKNYEFSLEEDGLYIYVTSYNQVNGKNFCVVSRFNASEVYWNLQSQIKYFRLVIILVIAFASLGMWGISRLLTRPLEELTRSAVALAQGDYGVRATKKSQDEVGILSEQFNCMAEAISNHVEELEDMVRRREQFVGDFTHEIKTPMTAIIGYADTLRSMELPREEEIKALTYIFSEGKRLERMSASLFDLLYLKNHAVSLTAVNTLALTDKLQETVEPLLAGKKQKLFVVVEEAFLMANQDLLITAFVNMVDNARKASSEGSSIELRGKISGQSYLFELIDSGCGMTQETIAHIYDEFYMEDKSRSRKEGGAGLGMSMVRLIIDLHHGIMEIDSKPGFGTKISLTFSLEEVTGDV